MIPAMYAWRHPRPFGADGRCIGAGTELAVDPRRAKRLARRIQRVARRERLPHIVVTSGAERCTAVGRCLRRWGWQHRIDPALAELNFGAWEGRAWSQIDAAEVDAWCNDFAAHAPGGGEALQSLLRRAVSWQPGEARCVVTHGGWLLARYWAELHPDGLLPQVGDWPAAPGYGACLALRPVLLAEGT
jgi:alpha-ribazole phosphatase